MARSSFAEAVRPLPPAGPIPYAPVKQQQSHHHGAHNVAHSRDVGSRVALDGCASRRAACSDLAAAKAETVEFSSRR